MVRRRLGGDADAAPRASRTSATARAVLTCATCSRPPVSSASAMSRATITSSAAAGRPRRPSRSDVGPSFITPPSHRCSSSSCAMTGRSKSRVYSSARRMSPASITGRPSSDTATMPARCISPISASRSPSSPSDSAPIGCTRAPPASAARSRMKRVTAPLSFTGSVFAMQAIDVKPPASAAATPVATVSLYSCPGSRRWTCMSTRPGRTSSPRASSTVASVASVPAGPRAAMRPSSIRTSSASTVPATGSTSRPPASSRRPLTRAPRPDRVPAPRPARARWHPRPCCARPAGRAAPSARRRRWSPGS